MRGVEEEGSSAGGENCANVWYEHFIRAGAAEMKLLLSGWRSLVALQKYSKPVSLFFPFRTICEDKENPRARWENNTLDGARCRAIVF